MKDGSGGGGLGVGGRRTPLASAAFAPATMGDAAGRYVGAMVTYADGSQQLKVGNVWLDVAPPAEVEMRQEVALVDHAEGSFVYMGSVERRVVLSPDMETLVVDAASEERGGGGGEDLTMRP